MDKNVSKQELRQLQEALNSKRILLSKTLTQIFDLEAKIKAIKTNLKESQPGKISVQVNKIGTPRVVLYASPLSVPGKRNPQDGN